MTFFILINSYHGTDRFFSLTKQLNQGGPLHRPPAPDPAPAAMSSWVWSGIINLITLTLTPLFSPPLTSPCSLLSLLPALTSSCSHLSSHLSLLSPLPPLTSLLTSFCSHLSSPLLSPCSHLTSLLFSPLSAFTSLHLSPLPALSFPLLSPLN